MKQDVRRVAVCHGTSKRKCSRASIHWALKKILEQPAGHNTDLI